MMERIAESDARITGIGEHLRRPLSMGKQIAEPASDPVESLRAERERVLVEARLQGHAEGMRMADAEIQERASAAEARFEQTRAAESDRLRRSNQTIEVLLRDLPLAVDALDERVACLASEIAYTALVRMLGESGGDAVWKPALCRQALDEVKLRPVTLHVAPGFAAGLDAVARAEQVRVVEDAALGPVSCRLETNRGIYDGGLEVRLEALKQALLRGLRMEPEA